jgi:hypothetical protein
VCVRALVSQGNKKGRGRGGAPLLCCVTPAETTGGEPAPFRTSALN